MIYYYNEKPYVRVAHYYKEVSIEKNGKEYVVKPVGGKETRVEKPEMSNILAMDVDTYFKKYKKTSKNENKDIF